jgi:outer membrane protein assembly factor BamB
MLKFLFRVESICCLLILAAIFISPVLSESKVVPKKHSKTSQPIQVGPLIANWPMWGGSPARNNVSPSANIPTDWNIGKFDNRTGDWLPETARNIKWVAKLGSVSYGTPIVADGNVFVGTNNAAGYIDRYPSKVDLGCMLCFRESDGEFLWQYSAKKLPTGRAHDWPMQGICSSPYVEANRMWFVDNRGQVVCLDPQGFHDGKNNGPFKDEENEGKREADIIWQFDMMAELGVLQRNMASCSPAVWGDVLFICTSNGLDSSQINIPAPGAPSFIAMDKNSGKVLWTDNSPGNNILHGQWSSPAIGVLGGVPQVIFPGGDGWLYSFRADDWLKKKNKPILLWKFDCNPKESRWVLGGRGTRNNILSMPVIHDRRVYVAVGQSPSHGEGDGHLWCIDPKKRGDVSPELAVKIVDGKGVIIPHRRTQAVNTKDDEIVVENPNSAVIWHFDKYDQNDDGKFDFYETFHRTISSPVIKDNFLIIPDISGLVHCLNANTGEVHWSYDLFSACWSTALIAGDTIYVGDEDGDVAIFPLSTTPKNSLKPGGDFRKRHIHTEPDNEIYMERAINSTPVAVNDTLYIVTRNRLYAIQKTK